MQDEELKKLIPKLLPGRVGIWPVNNALYWISEQRPVKDTELLSLCWEVDETFTEKQQERYAELLFSRGDTNKAWMWNVAHASWQQRIQATAEVRGIL